MKLDTPRECLAHGRQKEKGLCRGPSLEDDIETFGGAAGVSVGCRLDQRGEHD